MTNILGKIKTFHKASKTIDIIEIIERDSYQENFSIEKLRDKYSLDMEIFSEIRNIDEMRSVLVETKKILTESKIIEVTTPLSEFSDSFIDNLYKIFSDHGHNSFLLKMNTDAQNKCRVAYEADGFYHDISLTKIVKNILVDVYAKK